MGRPFYFKRRKMAAKKVKVRILLPVSGAYALSASVGDVVSYPATLANQLVEDKYAEFVK